MYAIECSRPCWPAPYHSEFTPDLAKAINQGAKLAGQLSFADKVVTVKRDHKLIATFEVA
jgi:hypothetical protein